MDFKKIIENTIVPMNFSVEEKTACYDKIIRCVKDILPNKLYRFRTCSERSLSAFYNDELWFSNGSTMNDDFDARLYYDKKRIENEYGYAASRIQLETPIHFGREVKRADITIMDKDRPMVPYIIVELKKPKLTDGKEQLKSYCNATGAPIGVWTNGEQISCYNRKDPNFFEEISDIPKVTQKLSDIINEKFTYEDLKRTDKISTQKKSLRALIKEMEDEVLASAGVDSFEEIFKLIFAKLYDELICANDPTAYLQFRNNGNTDYELKEKIQGLFDDAKKKWEGIFTDESKILLSPSHLAVCVASLQDIKLFNNNLDVVDDAFEYLMSKAQKGEKGQYFTPRYVIDMCVKMMNPTIKDKIIDTACGSSGFTVHSIFKVWKDIRRGKGL